MCDCFLSACWCCLWRKNCSNCGLALHFRTDWVFAVWILWRKKWDGLVVQPGLVIFHCWPSAAVLFHAALAGGCLEQRNQPSSFVLVNASVCWNCWRLCTDSEWRCHTQWPSCWKQNQLPGFYQRRKRDWRRFSGKASSTSVHQHSRETNETSLQDFPACLWKRFKNGSS